MQQEIIHAIKLSAIMHIQGVLYVYTETNASGHYKISWYITNDTGEEAYFSDEDYGSIAMATYSGLKYAIYGEQE